MNDFREKYYPTILQAIHLLILYLFIQSVVDFPLAMIDYYNDTEYLYHPVKKILMGVGSTLFILWYGYKKSGAKLKEVFPSRRFNFLVLIPVTTFLWGMQNILDVVNAKVESIIPPPSWFWELFNRIFESDFGWWGAFFKVAVVAPVVEELIFRGIIFRGLRRNYHPWIAITMSALLFALFHLNPWQFPATFMLGLLLGWLMYRFNNIFLAIAGHSINNFLVLAVMTWWNSLQSFRIYQLGQPGLAFWGGVIVIVSAILIYLIFHFSKKSKING
jgi:hypothetical protein